MIFQLLNGNEDIVIRSTLSFMRDQHYERVSTLREKTNVVILLLFFFCIRILNKLFLLLDNFDSITDRDID